MVTKLLLSSPLLFNLSANNSINDVTSLLDKISENENYIHLNIGKTFDSDDLVTVFKSIKKHVASLRLISKDFLHKISKDELEKVFVAIPESIEYLNLCDNELSTMPVFQLEALFGAIPRTVKVLDLTRNKFINKATDELVRIFSLIPDSVEYLDLSWNGIEQKPDIELQKIFDAIPNGVTRLGLYFPGLEYKTTAELQGIFKALPKSVTHLELDWGAFNKIAPKQLAQIFSSIPDSLILNEKTNVLREKYDINYLLDSYLKERGNMTDSSGKVKEYFYGSFFSLFQKSYTQKVAAISALKDALDGKDGPALKEHISTLENGTLGKKLREFIKSGASEFKVDTLSDFVKALENKRTESLKVTPARSFLS